MGKFAKIEKWKPKSCVYNLILAFLKRKNIFPYSFLVVYSTFAFLFSVTKIFIFHAPKYFVQAQILQFFGRFVFVVLCFLAVYFYLERSVFMDIAFHLFTILKQGDFAIQNNRFVAAFTQSTVVVGQKLGVPLSVIALVYSSSFALLYLLAYVVIRFGSKNVAMSWVYVLFGIMMVSHTFYWIQSELPQGMAVFFIFFAYLESLLTQKSFSIKQVAFIAIGLFVVSFAHPLIIFPFVFVCVYFYLRMPQRLWNLVYILCMFFLFYGIKMVLFKTYYDSQSINGLKNLLNYFPYYWQMDSMHDFARYLLSDYYFFAIIFVVNVYFYLYSRQYIPLLLMTAFTLGYILMVNGSYPSGAEQFYLENQYLLLAVFVAFPFVYEVLPRVKNPLWIGAILYLICLTGIGRIYLTHFLYTQRLQWYETFLQAHAQEKLIIRKENTPQKLLMMNWASCYEFWLLSTIQQNQSCSFIIEDATGEFDWTVNTKDSFISKWGVFPYESLPPQYFKFYDTTSSYQKY